jgi:hypothetical protein
VVGMQASPMFAPRYRERVAMYVGRLPNESDIDPKKEGVIA